MIFSNSKISNIYKKGAFKSDKLSNSFNDSILAVEKYMRSKFFLYIFYDFKLFNL